MKLLQRTCVIVAIIMIAEVFFEMNGCGASVFVATKAVQNLVTHHKPIQLKSLDPDLDSVYSYFDPSLQPYLKQVPIVISETARTSYCMYIQTDKAVVVLSPDFFQIAQQSEYWNEVYSKPPYNLQPDQSIFSKDFKFMLLTHELLHIAQAYLGLTPKHFFVKVEKWYRDESYGRPTQPNEGLDNSINSNSIKYQLWWYLYGQPGNPGNQTDNGWGKMNYCDYYRNTDYGIEEFAYIGQAIANTTESGSRTGILSQLSEALANSYAGIINPAILR